MQLENWKQAHTVMATAKLLTDLYEENFKIVSKYVHATSRGHEAIQIACGMQLNEIDYVYPYYRDDAMLLAMGIKPYELMLQLFAKKNDIFSGGRTYYCHPSLKKAGFPKIPHQSSATGMQAIPAAGAALGLVYKKQMGLLAMDENPIVVCSLGDAAVTEGEVSEAFQMAALKSLPILFLVQDNGWDISAKQDETRTWNAAQYVSSLNNIETISIDGSDFELCYKTIEYIFEKIRKEQRPFLLHAVVPLLNHHTSGVRKEWYRDDLEEHQSRDPFIKLEDKLVNESIFSSKELSEINEKIKSEIAFQFEEARQTDDPEPADLMNHIFAPNQDLVELGSRSGVGNLEKNMVDCGIFAISEIMNMHKECLFYGQDVGNRLGGVFREAATLAQQFGQNRVFNTPIQEAFIVGSTVGMAAVGLRPIVEVQFADYIWPGLNQLFTEVGRSYYLTNGKWPIPMILRVPCGAYGSGGPYHSSSVESIVTNIKGIKVIYPSTAADLKGLMKSAYYDDNPVVFLEHKGLYWSKLPGTEESKSIEPDENYRIPIGKARLVKEASNDNKSQGKAITVITYGMGVYWALPTADALLDQVDLIDLRTLSPIDWQTIENSVNQTGRCICITEETETSSFMNGICGQIQSRCFEALDAPVKNIGSKDTPAIPLNSILEQALLPNAKIVQEAIQELLSY